MFFANQKRAWSILLWICNEYSVQYTSILIVPSRVDRQSPENQTIQIILRVEVSTNFLNKYLR